MNNSGKNKKAITSEMRLLWHFIVIAFPKCDIPVI